jgi:metal-responsive CopG/Arc/MetJ family transcriptional regulator
VRTTITFDDDVAAELDRLRRERGVGVSEVVNDLIRRGLAPQHERTIFEQQTAALGLAVDVRNVADALDLLDGPGAP